MITNCKRCRKVFKKTMSDACPECVERESQQFQQIYRMLQNSREGIVIDELSEKTGMPVSVIEEYYFDAKFGTAGLFLKFRCKGCKEIMDEGHRKGRYCHGCSDDISGKAGVEVRSLQNIDKAALKEQQMADQKALLEKKRQAMAARLGKSDGGGRRGSGFIRNR